MVHYSLRFPDDLYDAVKAAAVDDTRSIHGEILWLIRRGLQADGRPAPRVERDPPPT